MPTLHVQDLPKDLYMQLHYLAEKEHRSLMQEVIILLREGVDTRMGNKERRRDLLKIQNPLGIQNSADLPDPVALIREDRDR